MEIYHVVTAELPNGDRKQMLIADDQLKEYPKLSDYFRPGCKDFYDHGTIEIDGDCVHMLYHSYLSEW